MKVKFFMLVVVILAITACGTQQTPSPDINIVPSTCQVRAEHKIPLTIQDSGKVKREKVEWIVIAGSIEQQGDGKIAVYTAPKEAGNQYIIATVYYVDGTEKTATIICEVLLTDSLTLPTGTATPIYTDIISPPAAITAVVKVASINLFTGPGGQYPVLPSEYLKGTLLIVEGKNEFNSWLLVLSPNNIRGWVYMEWINIDQNLLVQIPITNFIAPSSMITATPEKKTVPANVQTKIGPTTSLILTNIAPYHTP